ncbi:MAG TPA: hypothetical protein VIN03_16645 [Roseateles sp.]
MQNNFINEKPLGYQQITSLSGAQGLTVPAGTKLALIQAETQAVRWRDDGTAPTATVGYPLAVGSELRYTGTAAALAAIRFIEQTASAKLNVSYYGNGEY